MLGDPRYLFWYSNFGQVVVVVYAIFLGFYFEELRDLKREEEKIEGPLRKIFTWAWSWRVIVPLFAGMFFLSGIFSLKDQAKELSDGLKSAANEKARTDANIAGDPRKFSGR
jgi:hypothetical protein